MSTELVKIEQLPINSMQDLSSLGEMLAKSGMFGAKNPAEGLVIAATCFQEKLSFMQFINTYHIIQGKPTMKADSMLASFISDGGKVNWITTDNNTAKAEFIAPNGSSITESFDMADAKLAGLATKDNWKKYPKSMLRSRCISSALRAIYPISTNCVHTPEEIEAATPINVTPQELPQKAKEEHIKKVMAEAEINPPPERFPTNEPDPFDKQIKEYTKCPIPGKMMDAAWVDMPLTNLRIAEKMKHESLMRGHYKAINEAIKTKELAEMENLNNA